MFLRICIFLQTLLLVACSSSEKVGEKKPIQIQFVSPSKSNLPVFSEYVGQTFGKSDVQIPARVDGVIEHVHYKEGDPVTKGQLLYTIDPVEYQTKVDEADGELEKAKSELVNAQEDLKRIKPLADMNAVSKRDLDEAIAKEKNCTPSQLALAWVIAQEDFIFPIPGTKRVKYVEENVKAVDVKLSEHDLEQIEDVFPKNAAVGSRYTEAGMKTVNL